MFTFADVTVQFPVRFDGSFDGAGAEDGAATAMQADIRNVARNVWKVRAAFLKIISLLSVHALRQEC